MNRTKMSLYLRPLISTLLIIAFFTSGYVVRAKQGQPAVFVIEAPTQVEVGDRIEIQLIVDHAQDLAGYEAQLLFDPSAAHFSGLHQRDSDLKKFGRDVIPLEAPELSDGVALGLASCPFPDCVEMTGNAQPRGANGRVRLGSVLIGTDQEGLLELSFEHLKFVDASGNVIPVEIPHTRISVQVGQGNGVQFHAPASSWQWSVSPASPESSDVTGEGAVNYADATETAFEWKLAREQGQPCGPLNDLSRDVNKDSCIDVADIQWILANTTATAPRAQSSRPANPNGSATTSDAQIQAAVAAGSLTFTVDSTSDAADSNIGDGICASSAGCTLRAAINEANSHGGPDTILFNIPGSGVHTIQLTSRLPSLFDGSGGTTIDGYSQPGAQANTDSVVSNAVIMIELRGNGPSAFDATLLQSAGNRIQGLAIFNMRRSVWISGSGARNNFIVGNFLGTNAAGTFGLTVHTLNASGIEIEGGATANHVGGPSPADRNVISGNARQGIDFKSQGTESNEVYNNLIGLNPAGTQRLENMRHGIDINAGASRNIIGGTAAGQRNILSGNGENQNAAFTAGIEISHDTLTTGNQVIGNCIGTDPSCNSGPSWALNRHYGVRMEDGVNNNIIANNVIGNNPQGGIRITGSGSNRNQVHDNRIGISLNNTSIPNGFFGIEISRATKFNKIGPNNIITNSPKGIQLFDDGTDAHTITRNSIYNNTQLGIDLGPTTGVSPNDSGDGDIGPNEVLNWPILEGATVSQVTGTACAETGISKPCTIEVFIAERVPSDSGGGNYGQGRTFVGSGTTSNNGSFAVAISGVAAGQYLTATATDASGNTSEFAFNILVSGSGGSPTPTPTSPPSTPTPTSPPATPTPTITPPGATTFVSDTFTRSITDGWGSADTGGSYTLSGIVSDFDVDGSAGTMVVPLAGGARVATLQGVSERDVDFLFRVETDKLAVGNNLAVLFIARNVSSNSEYRCQVRIATSNTVNLRAIKVVNGTQTGLGTEVTVSGLTYQANRYIWIRGQVVGANPTTIRLKVWVDGQTEPASWQYTVTDSESSLQTAGAVGLRSLLASGVTNAPVVFTFDDLEVTSP